LPNFWVVSRKFLPKIRPWLWLYQIILSGFEMICSYYSTTPVLARLKVIWTLLLITLASLSPIAAFPTELQKEGNPELYTRLLPLAGRTSPSWKKQSQSVSEDVDKP
jgi:hypothetical protein